nr:hypothetical protein [uncultured Fluviicola sp.]
MKISIVLLSVLVSVISFSQQRDSLKTKTPRFIVKMTHGMTSSNQFDFTNSEWDRMTPGFQIPDSLKPGLGVNYSKNLHSFTSDSYYMFSFSFINGKDKQAGRKFQATTVIHLGYGPELRASKYWYHENIQVIDTLTSNQNGQEYYVTGNRNQTIAKTYHSRTVAFGVGQHIATNPTRVFQFETGLDLLCLISVTSKVRASYLDTYLVDGLPNYNNLGNYPYTNSDPESNRSETFSGYITTGLIMRIPLEMSFKLSKKNPVLSRMRIGGELNPGLAMQFTKGKTSDNFSMSGGMNFRFAF